MKFYLQYGVPNLRPRVFLDTELHPLSKPMQEIYADDWKEARERVGAPPPPPADDE